MLQPEQARVALDNQIDRLNLLRTNDPPLPFPPSSQVAGELRELRCHYRVGTSNAAISRLESGRHAPTAETLRKIARAFGGHLVIGLEIPAGKAQETQTVLARVS